MKIMKKIFSVMCAIGIVSSMISNVYAESIFVDDALSLTLTDNTKENNTVDIDIKTSYDAIQSATFMLRVPKELQDYIDSWVFSTTATGIKELILNNTWQEYPKAPNYAYIQQSVIFEDQSDPRIIIPENDVIVKATITLKEGGIPASLSEAERTITLGAPLTGSNVNGKKGATTIDDVEGIKYYLKTTETTFDDTTGKFNYMNFDVTAEDNYVVLPTAKPDDPITATVVGDTLVGDKTEAGNDDESDKAVAIFGTPVAPAAHSTSLVWTVTNTSDVTKTFTQAVDVEGGATYNFGLVLRNITKDLVKSVSAAFAQ